MQMWDLMTPMLMVMCSRLPLPLTPSTEHYSLMVMEVSLTRQTQTIQETTHSVTQCVIRPGFAPMPT